MERHDRGGVHGAIDVSEWMCQTRGRLKERCHRGYPLVVRSRASDFSSDLFRRHRESRGGRPRTGPRRVRNKSVTADVSSAAFRTLRYWSERIVVILGEEEEENGAAAVRHRGGPRGCSGHRVVGLRRLTGTQYQAERGHLRRRAGQLGEHEVDVEPVGKGQPSRYGLRFLGNSHGRRSLGNDLQVPG